MNIGILSMQEVKNYGSFLQAFSLKKNIEALGHSVDFINIIPGRQLAEYRQTKFAKVEKLVTRLRGWDFAKRFRTIYQFQTRFKKEFLPYLGAGLGNNDKHYDCIVIGSDEVFNFAQQTWFGFSPQLFGHGLNADKVITYAGSFGATDIPKIEHLGLKDELIGYLKDLAKISVRDRNSYKVVEGLTGIEPEVNVDPVFIYDYAEYIPQKHYKSDYIIVYSYPGRISDPKEIRAIQAFAKKKGLRLLSIGHYFPWCDDVVVPTPFEVLAYFRDAAYIVTDTFHGSVMSIKFNKQFATIVRGMNNNKLSYLLEEFGLSSRIVRDTIDLDRIEDTPINYKSVNDIIAREKVRSINYLSENINK